MKNLFIFAAALLLAASCTKIEEGEGVYLSVSFKSTPATLKSAQSSGHTFASSENLPTATADELGILEASLSISAEGTSIYSATIDAASLSSFNLPIDLGFGERVFNVTAVNNANAGVYGFDNESSTSEMVDDRLFMRFNSGDVTEDIDAAYRSVALVANLQNTAVVFDFESPLQGEYETPLVFKYTIICNSVTYEKEVPAGGGSYECVLNMDIEEMTITEIKRDLFVGDVKLTTDEILWDGNDISDSYSLTFNAGVLGKLSVSSTLQFQEITGSVVFQDWEEQEIELGE
jgi:hypothetical protein